MQVIYMAIASLKPCMHEQRHINRAPVSFEFDVALPNSVASSHFGAVSFLAGLVLPKQVVSFLSGIIADPSSMVQKVHTQHCSFEFPGENRCDDLIMIIMSNPQPNVISNLRSSQCIHCHNHDIWIQQHTFAPA